ncbi:hypothetical protein B1R32_10627 [Abditibacterium utsteinense]|uniref:DUF192 domain-containing protein n=1 Tax=Abditibacterium utsteinense TaxID=1960156 RepID=A0A2S8STP8_9BACT|nr:DUF192 domain-containing protein [Abditibacterium utsteinense]PQV64183.1 hypothetical protein B1R32_10627 [Abditibacterium utsteinense]
MKTLRLINVRTQTEIVARCALADKFWTRGKGLLGRASLPADEGILLVPGVSIHMFGMKFPIDAVFLTKDDVVTDFVENLAPGKMHQSKASAGKPHSTLELAAGTIQRVGICIGDKIEREEVAT